MWHIERTNFQIHSPLFTLCSACRFFFLHNCVRCNSNGSKSRTTTRWNESKQMRYGETYTHYTHTRAMHTMASSWTCGYHVNKEQLMWPKKIQLDSSSMNCTVCLCAVLVCYGIGTSSTRHKDRYDVSTAKINSGNKFTIIGKKGKFKFKFIHILRIFSVALLAHVYCSVLYWILDWNWENLLLKRSKHTYV